MITINLSMTTEEFQHCAAILSVEPDPTVAARLDHPSAEWLQGHIQSLPGDEPWDADDVTSAVETMLREASPAVDAVRSAMTKDSLVPAG